MASQVGSSVVPPQPGVVRLYLLRTNEMEGIQTQVAPLVAESFCRARNTVREQARLDSLGSGLLLRCVLNVSSNDQLERGRYGKPRLASSAAHERIHFNLSHDAGYVALGVAGEPLGVDVSRLACDQRVAERLFQPLGLASAAFDDTPEGRMGFSRTWTQLEAMLKASGVGFSTGVRKHPELLEGWHVWSKSLDGAMLSCACANPFEVQLVPFNAREELARLQV